MVTYRMTNPLPVKLVGAVVLATIAVLTTTTAQAKLVQERTLYVSKFVCGLKTGFTPPQAVNLAFSPILYDYREVEPGSYASILNIFYAGNGLVRFGDSIDVYASVKGVSPNPLVKSFAPFSFRTDTVDCGEIRDALANALPQKTANFGLIEGYLYILRPSDDLEAQTVYTYSTGEIEIDGLGSSIDVERVTPRTTTVFEFNPF